MSAFKTIGLAVVLLVSAGMDSNRVAMAKGPLCTMCPASGVDARATKSVGGAAQPGGPCKAGRASNGMTLPDPKCTPGAFNPTVTADRFGSKKFKTDCVRDCLTDGKKKSAMYGNYGIKRDGSCELDHLVPLEMGGADSLDNIWPQCGPAPGGKNAKDVKDVVENYLTIQVLKGMDIDKARKGISTDWTQFIADATKFCASNSCDISQYRK